MSHDPHGQQIASGVAPKTSPWWRHFSPTHLVAWLTFLYVFVVQGDELMSVLNRRLLGPGNLDVVEFTHVSDTHDCDRRDDADESGRSGLEDTDFVDLTFKVVNRSEQTILVQRVEVEIEAHGAAAGGKLVSPCSHLEMSGEYKIVAPNLSPGEQATRYVAVPHVVKPQDADAFSVTLLLADAASVTGRYTIRTRLVTSAGTETLESFDVPVRADSVEATPLNGK
jgi:hypothetical protein